MPFWPMVWFLLAGCAIVLFANKCFALVKIAKKQYRLREFTRELCLCFGFCVIFIAIAWRFNLLYTPIHIESLESLDYVEGFGYAIPKKGNPNLGVETRDGERYDMPVFDFSLSPKGAPSHLQIKRMAFGHQVKIWYKEKNHRYIYQISIDNEIIYDVQSANENVASFNQWGPTCDFILYPSFFLLLYLSLFIEPRFKHLLKEKV